MNVASLELCRELWELSGWEIDDGFGNWWFQSDEKQRPRKNGKSYSVGQFVPGIAPAYDLGYLLRKLPNRSEVLRLASDIYEASYYFKDDKEDLFVKANTPEDAACKLAIELFKQGVLTKGGK